jgi:hypothetical protein
MEGARGRAGKQSHAITNIHGRQCRLHIYTIVVAEYVRVLHTDERHILVAYVIS